VARGSVAAAAEGGRDAAHRAAAGAAGAAATATVPASRARAQPAPVGLGGSASSARPSNRPRCTRPATTTTTGVNRLGGGRRRSLPFSSANAEAPAGEDHGNDDGWSGDTRGGAVAGPCRQAVASAAAASPEPRPVAECRRPRDGAVAVVSAQTASADAPAQQPTTWWHHVVVTLHDDDDGDDPSFQDVHFACCF
jgi:hypothetical protein